MPRHATGILKKPHVRRYLGFFSCHRPSSIDQFSDSGIVATDVASVELCSNTKPSPPFAALLMGINNYASSEIYDLDGAVPDALAFKKYLEDDLGVPASRIRLLLDAEATRSAIIQEFDNLIADQRINRGDPILIFYAGHGGEVNAPKGWEAGSPKIQMLIPYDYRSDVDGLGIYGIPDRTIGTLLSRVAEKCGDNIVCLPIPCNNVYTTDEIVCIDSHLRLLLLWIHHP
jgi:hypothetical protein